MKTLQFVDRISGGDLKTRITADGYLVGEARCARTGIQTYGASEMGLPGSGTINVYRPEDAVFHKDSLASYAGKPVTLHHPPVPVTADNWKDYAVGTVGETVARDGETVRVQFALMDGKAIKDVQDGTCQVSMGYTTPIEMRDGVAPDGTPYQAVQTGPIRINHFAIVDRARGGEELNIPVIRDSQWGHVPVTQQKDTAPMHRILFDGITIEVNDQAREAIAKLQGQVTDAAKRVSDAEAELAKKDVELAAKDSELEAKDKAIADAKAEVPTGPVLDALVAERAQVVDAARSIDAELKVDGVSNADIKKAAVRAAMTDAVVDAKIAGKSAAYVDAFYDANFDRLAEDHASTTQLADSLGNRTVRLVADADKDEEDAFNKTKDRFNRKKKA